MELGSCFESSCEAFLNMKKALPDIYPMLKEVKLVHGIVTGTGGDTKNIEYCHGWVEFTTNNGDEFCFDTETGYLVTKCTFYMVGKVRDAQPYSMKTVLGRLCKYDHYGPWEEALIEIEREINPTFNHAKKGVHYG